jgi:putative ABC transport system substrate-binding protein
VPRIGLLDNSSFAARDSQWEAFRQAMRQLGYIEGRTVSFEARGADGKMDWLPALAAELVRLKVDVIVTAGNPALRAAREATATIPIVTASGDSLEIGIVTSLARPGGNVTGLTTQSLELMAKRLELARELVPEASRFAILWNAGGTVRALRETETAARALGVSLHAVGVRSPAELDGAFSTIARGGPGVLVLVPSALFLVERRRVADLAVTHRLPTVHSSREMVEAGGLIAYGTNLAALFRRAAVYVDKILKGAKPGNLPIEQPTQFDLIVNLQTAAKLGFTIPQSILLRADETIR